MLKILIVKELQKATSKLSLLVDTGMTQALEKSVQKSEVHCMDGVCIAFAYVSVYICVYTCVHTCERKHSCRYRARLYVWM